MISFFDNLLISSFVAIIILAILHEIFGYKAYLKGSSVGIFFRNANWIASSSKEKTLVGVFFMISFAWWQSSLITILILIIGNPLEIWIGIISLLSSLSQFLLLRKYVKWNKLAQGVFILNILTSILWIINFEIS